MPAFLAFIPLRYWLYGAAALAIIVGAIGLRAHFVNQGWDRALEAVKTQDATAKAAASTAQSKVDRCYEAGNAWSTISGTCTEAKP
jgi:hypothetical protein